MARKINVTDEELTAFIIDFGLIPALLVTPTLLRMYRHELQERASALREFDPHTMSVWRKGCVSRCRTQLEKQEHDDFSLQLHLHFD